MTPATTRNRPLVVPALAILAALAAVLVALPVAAETYHVELENGHAYETKYPPEEASWDSGTLLIITETGNWIGLDRSKVASIEAETERRGHGKRLNATTLFMGRTPSSIAAAPEELSLEERQVQALESFVNQQQQQPTYSMDQFVEPGQLGTGTSGIPLSFTQQVTPPIGVGAQNPR